jgi:hypothetical protein
MSESEEITALSQAISNVLTGEYRARRLTIPMVADLTGMSKWTLQKKLQGSVSVHAAEMVFIARAIGADPVDVLERAMKMADA